MSLPIPITSLRFIGRGLVRPECVLAHASGWLFAADWQGEGGVAAIAPDGRVRRIAAKRMARTMRPNGLALEPGGTFLLADLGLSEGGLFRLHADGRVDPVLVELDGRPFPPTNYVHRTEDGSLYVTVSTRRQPRDLGYRSDVDDGFIVLVRNGRASIVAEGLGYTNECSLSPDGANLWVNETFTRRLSRFPLRADGTLGAKEVIAEFGPGIYPDGLTLDAEGGIWITSIVSNTVLRIGPDGRQATWLEDADPEHVAWAEAAYREGRLGRPHLDRAAGRRLANISSLAFGGPQLRTAYLGCLLGDSIAAFDSPVAGAPAPHFNFPLGALAGLLEQKDANR